MTHSRTDEITINDLSPEQQKVARDFEDELLGWTRQNLIGAHVDPSAFEAARSQGERLAETYGDLIEDVRASQGWICTYLGPEGKCDWVIDHDAQCPWHGTKTIATAIVLSWTFKPHVLATFTVE